eukprot:c1472_g1_i1.p1 GENE.c1472_g1_i1~~c1472_g1_i1.p1  ORF type:complete len:288 (-),score=47.88 c1472_g1_i1:161-1024(-)
MESQARADMSLRRGEVDPARAAQLLRYLDGSGDGSDGSSNLSEEPDITDNLSIAAPSSTVRASDRARESLRSLGAPPSASSSPPFSRLASVSSVPEPPVVRAAEMDAGSAYLSKSAAFNMELRPQTDEPTALRSPPRRVRAPMTLGSVKASSPVGGNNASMTSYRSLDSLKTPTSRSPGGAASPSLCAVSESLLPKSPTTGVFKRGRQWTVPTQLTLIESPDPAQRMTIFDPLPDSVIHLWLSSLTTSPRLGAAGHSLASLHTNVSPRTPTRELNSAGNSTGNSAAN